MLCLWSRVWARGSTAGGEGLCESCRDLTTRGEWWRRDGERSDLRVRVWRAVVREVSGVAEVRDAGAERSPEMRRRVSDIGLYRYVHSNTF